MLIKIEHFPYENVRIPGATVVIRGLYNTYVWVDLT